MARAVLASGALVIGTRIDRVPKPIMVMRSLRVPEALWVRAKTLADKRDENISDVIRRALERYLEDES